MRALGFVPVLFVGLAISGCATQPGIQEENVFYPLEVGNRWEFVSVDDSSKTDVIVVMKSQSIDNQRWYAVKEFSDIFWVRNSAEGQYDAGSSDDGRLTVDMVAGADLFFRSPSDLGYKRYPLCDAPDQDCGTLTYEAIEDECQVPAGTFECFRYTLQQDQNLMIRWVFAPGIGVIEYRYQDGTAGTDDHFVLRHYELQGGVEGR